MVFAPWNQECSAASTPPPLGVPQLQPVDGMYRQMRNITSNARLQISAIKNILLLRKYDILHKLRGPSAVRSVANVKRKYHTQQSALTMCR